MLFEDRNLLDFINLFFECGPGAEQWGGVSVDYNHRSISNVPGSWIFDRIPGKACLSDSDRFIATG